jgi:hypothetical protein
MGHYANVKEGVSMNNIHKLGLFSWICQWVCLIVMIIVGHQQLFLTINILFFNITMASLFLGNSRAYGDKQ